LQDIQDISKKLMCHPVKPHYINHVRICAEISLLSAIGVQANCWSIILVTMKRLLSGECYDERALCNGMAVANSCVAQ